MESLITYVWGSLVIGAALTIGAVTCVLDAAGTFTPLDERPTKPLSVAPASTYCPACLVGAQEHDLAPAHTRGAVPDLCPSHCQLVQVWQMSGQPFEAGLAMRGLFWHTERQQGRA